MTWDGVAPGVGARGSSAGIDDESVDEIGGEVSRFDDDPDLGPAPKPMNVLATMRRFGPLLVGQRWKLSAAVLLYILEVGTNVATVAVFAYIVQNVLVTGDFSALVVPMAVWIAVSLLGSACSYVGAILTGSVTENMLLRLRDAMYAHTQRLAPHTRQQFETGDLIARHSSDVDSIDALLSSGMVQGLVAAVSLVVYAIAAFVTRWDLALLAALLAPLLWVLSRWFGRVVKRAARRERRANGRIASLLQEGITFALSIQADNQSPRDRLRVLRQSRAWRDARLAEIRANAVFSETVSIVEVLCMMAVLVVGAWEISVGRANIGILIALTGYLGYLYPQIQTLGSLVVSVTGATASAERVAEVLDAPIGIADSADDARRLRATGDVESDALSRIWPTDMSDDAVEAHLLAVPTGPVAPSTQITLSGVNFSYPGADMPVFRDADLRIGDGDFVALLGPSGAGKSTLMYLLLRFYDADSGTITLNGTDIRSMSVTHLRRHISVLQQQVALFGTSVTENIRYSRPDATDAQVRAAADAADATSFIEALPQGFDTHVQERGANLSGGQRQRIALARAFLRDTPLLILDEPTTGLDADTVTRVMEPMTRIARSRTTLLITHDPAVAALADYTVRVTDQKLVRD
ncbi:MAG: ABC transporter ATP-binding protein [Gordonia sp. (in: high G+C Gram-positive bacteria)]